jgi:hypothetical protein
MQEYGSSDFTLNIVNNVKMTHLVQATTEKLNLRKFRLGYCSLNHCITAIYIQNIDISTNKRIY